MIISCKLDQTSLPAIQPSVDALLGATCELLTGPVVGAGVQVLRLLVIPQEDPGAPTVQVVYADHEGPLTAEEWTTPWRFPDDPMPQAKAAPDGTYILRISEAQRVALLDSLSPGLPPVAADHPLEYWLEMLTDLPKDEAENPGIQHGFCL